MLGCYNVKTWVEFLGNGVRCQINITLSAVSFCLLRCIELSINLVIRFDPKRLVYA